MWHQKALYTLYITIKTERFSFKSWHVVLVAKHLKEDWFKALRWQLQLKNNFAPQLKIANVKCKSRLKVKFKFASGTMHSLVMGPFSCDIKMEID